MNGIKQRLKSLVVTFLGIVLLLVVVGLVFVVTANFYTKEAEKQANQACSLVVSGEKVTETIEKFKRQHLKYYYWKNEKGEETLFVEIHAFLFSSYVCSLTIQEGIVKGSKVNYWD